MTATPVVPPVLEIDGPAAPPRANGELLFDEPWESRAFGMAVTLADSGAFTWDEFRERLVAAVAGWEADHAVDAPPAGCSPGFSYYRCWLEALESLLVGNGTLAASDVTDRTVHLGGRPAGHDHDHDGRHHHH